MANTVTDVTYGTTSASWGFGAGNIWSDSMYVVSALGGFLLLGIVITFAPTVFRMIKGAISARGGRS